MKVPPNFVLVMPDQQRADSLGCYGNRFVQTPNIDALAAQAVRFERAFTTYPVCTPARATMWSGLYPHAHGLIENYYGVDDLFATEARVRETVFHWLKQAGYLAAYFGKWHLGEKRPAWCDVWSGFNSRGGHWVDGYQSFQDGRYRPEVQTEECIAFLESERAQARPFVMVQGYYPPHHPYTAPLRYYEPYRGRGVPFAGYYAAVSALDDCTGRILRTLDDTGLAASTWVFYFADHGDTFRYRPDGEHKFVCHDESIRIPFIVRPPGGARASVVDAPVGLQDIAPTLLDLAGLPVPQTLHGRSLQALLEGTASDWRSAFYVQTITYEKKLVQRSIRTEAWKLILSENGPHSLYDLKSDPEEVLDIYDVPRQDVHDQYLHFADPRETIRGLALRLREEAEAIDDAVGIRIAERALGGAHRSA